MPGPFSWLPQQKEVGDQGQVKKFYQNQNFSQPQQFAQNAFLAKAMQGMLMPQGQSFEPMYQEAMRAHRENTIPGIMNQVGQRPNSSAYQQAFGRGNEDLAVRLGALRSEWQDKQNERASQNARSMMQYGMEKPFETVYAPVPTESVKAYLKQEGIEDTPLNREKYMPMFEPQQSLGQKFSQSLPTAPEKIGNFLGGLPQNAQGVWDRMQRAYNAAKYGRPEGKGQGALTNQELIERDPATKAAIEKSIIGATQSQIAAKDWVIQAKNARMPILDSNLQAEDWPMLKEMMGHQSPEVRNMAYELSNRGQLEKMYKLLRQFNMAKNVKAQEKILKQINSLKKTFSREWGKNNA
jgi:hypothetical protein